ncbi:hypothetical protein [Clostridium sp.]
MFIERDESLSLKRDEAIKLINEATEKIISIREKIEEKNNEIPDLQILKRQLDEVYYMLGKKQSDIKKDFAALGIIIGKIRDKQVDILNEKTEIMLATIRANLPNDMVIIPDNNDIKEGKLTYNDAEIGKLRIKQEIDKIIVSVKINDYDKNFVDFHVDDELKMYPIINHIITKFNYKIPMKTDK